MKKKNTRYWLGVATVCAAWLQSLLVASAQSLVITNGTQTYLGFTNTTVSMSGQCALVVTGTNNPLYGSTIHLNSSNAWFFLPNVRPSVAASSYLSHVLINGAAAAAGSNCRVDEYVMGTAIVPHAPSLKPLQVFSGPNFLGDSTSLGTYTYYTNAALGGFRWNISSFHLKRGYSATFAQYPDGTGASQVFVAQDGDLDVGLLPTNLDHQCNFVRVFPWRWTGKKGWGGGVQTIIDPLWYYDWNNGSSSSLDNEYVPMKWGGTTTWDPLSNLNSKQGSTEALGYNEPDSSAQSNVSVTNAIALWPYLMQSGLRIGAPAVSDSGVAGQGLDWLYSFMSMATNLGYRVDFIPIHFYKCSWSASQLSNYLAGVYQVTGRPIWVTEFNYGADWCSTGPSQSQEAADISSYISTLESAPFVERYAIYSYFATNRAMIVNGVLTPAGTNYLQQQSSMAYSQTMPPGGSRGIAQYSFENNVLDGSGYANNGLAEGVPAYTAGHDGQAFQFDGANNYIELPTTMATKTTFTFAAWVLWNGGSAWQRIFDFGNGTSQYMFLTPNSGSSTLRFAMTSSGSGSEQRVETSELTTGTWYHIAVTISGNSVKLYVNGVPAASSTSFTITPASFKPMQNYLGKSQFGGDPLFNGLMDDVIISDTAFTPTQIAALQTDTPPQFTNSVLSGGTAAIGVAYSGSITGTATDADSGDTLTYGKATGPAWLNVSANGTLSGTPTGTDGGTNNFTVCVTDAAGESACAMLTIVTPFTAGNSAWDVDASGNWSDSTKWTRVCPAGGAGLTANFNALDISANRTVVLDSSRSIGSLKFADISGAQAWTIAGSGGSVLTLDSGSSASPSISVGFLPTLATSNSATISATLAGSNGFTKSGWGALVLSGNNTLTGTLNVDTSSTYTNDGVVQLASAGAAANVSAIAIRNNNNGSSTLQLANGAVSPAAITLSGRNVNVPAIENVSGSNELTGNLSVNVGGGYYIIQSDAGTLNLGGVVSSAAGGTRNFTFQGAGNHFISGSIQNGGAATVNVIKQDAGTLILANTNTFTGGLFVGGGSVRIFQPQALQNTVISLGCAGSNGLEFGPITAASVGAITGINDIWLTNSSLAPVTLTNGANNSSSEYAGAFRGAGGLVKAGTGTLTLDGASSYTGATMVDSGTLKFGTATNYIASLQPVLWMSFDQAGSGMVTNQGTGGWAMNGTIVGSGASITSVGRFGNALYINGTGGAAATNIVLINSKVVDTSVANSWTLGYWVKTTTAGAVIMYQGDGGWSSSGQTTFLLNANSGSTAGTKAGAVRWAGGFLTGTAVLNDGNWHFITLVDRAGAETIYVDGAADGVSSMMSMALASDANQIWIGGSPDTDAGAVKMTGTIDDVCLFSRALSLAEIRGIYSNAPVLGTLPATTVAVASGATLDMAGISQDFGALADYNGAGGKIANNSTAPAVLTLGDSQTGSTEFSGSISDGGIGNAIRLVKTGSGTQVLDGVNVYHGTTVVSNGTLVVKRSLTTSAINVVGGALGGAGVISAPVTISSGGTLAPGDDSIGMLTIDGSLNLSGTTFLRLNPLLATNDEVAGVTAVNFGGALVVTNVGGALAANESFKLFNATVYTGTFAATNLPPLGGGLGWVFDSSAGTLSVVQSVSVIPPSLDTSVAGGSLTFSWPLDHTGWRLIAQTNHLASGLSLNTNDWTTVPDSAGTNRLTLPIDPNTAGGFYRLIYP